MGVGFWGCAGIPSDVFCMYCRLFVKACHSFLWRTFFLHVMYSLHWKLCNMGTRSTFSGPQRLPLCFKYSCSNFKIDLFLEWMQPFSLYATVGPFITLEVSSGPPLYLSSLITENNIQFVSTLKCCDVISTTFNF